MGSQEKAEKLLEVSNTLEHYSDLIDHALSYFIARAEKDNSPFADYLKTVKDGYHDEFSNAVEITGEVYSEMFSDEELDELIVLTSNPAMEKLRGLTSKIVDRVFEKYGFKPTLVKG